ncbi:MAG: preprotein translocase subunit YajC [Planctomycetota bacterium]|nr:preprotein translocase subunit YajC [Planctomycetota bacterium]
MIASLTYLLHLPLLLAQKGESSEPVADEKATGEPTQSLIVQILQDPFALIIISGMLFILLVLRPQQRQMKRQQQLLSGMKKNDRVITSGGVHGTVIQASTDETTVVIRIDDNSGARMTVNRDAIATIVTAETKDKKNL